MRTNQRILTNRKLWPLMALALGLTLTACGTRELGFADKISLGKTSLKFDHSGADLHENTLASQLERGRSSSTSGGGAG